MSKIIVWWRFLLGILLSSPGTILPLMSAVLWGSGWKIILHTKEQRPPYNGIAQKYFFSIFTAIQICNMFEETHIFTHCHHFMLYHCSFTCHTSSSIKQWCSWSHQKWMSFYKKQISMMWVQETEIKKATVWVCEKFLGGSIKFFPKSEQLQFFLVDQKV